MTNLNQTTYVQHDAHVAGWLKANFDLTVQDNEYAIGRKEWFAVFKGDYDLDIKYATGGPSVFEAAVEYAACYDERPCDLLVAIEMGV